MRLWRWLTTPDPNPGFTRSKLYKLTARIFLFAVFATLISSLLGLTPLGPYLNTWWGSLLFVLALYLPLSRFMMLDTFAPRRDRPGTPAMSSAAQGRKEKNRYAGVRKSPPKYGGRR